MVCFKKKKEFDQKPIATSPGVIDEGETKLNRKERDTSKR